MSEPNSTGLSESITGILACPNCSSSLNLTAHDLECSSCGTRYSRNEKGQTDLRLQAPKTVAADFQLGTSLLPDQGFDFTIMKSCPDPEVDFSNIKVPWHISPELRSYFPKAKGAGSQMLDLGCGTTVHKSIAEHAGFEYVGIDYDTHQAPILADAHALPFKDNSFEFILSIAVLEHIQYPFVMMKEVDWVLKPGGVFIGSVAFLEPFHSNSYYHHTHLGTYNVLRYPGLEIEKLAPSKSWSVLPAQAIMGLFPKLPWKYSKWLVKPTIWLHKLWWRYKKRSEEERILITSGAFYFVARKK